MAGQVEILHRTPGRMRLRIAYLKGDPEACEAVDKIAMDEFGLRRIKANPITGSVVVFYDATYPNVEHELMQALPELDQLLSFIAPDNEERNGGDKDASSKSASPGQEELLLDKLSVWIDKIDLHIRRFSGGAIDLATLVRLLLAGSVVLWTAQRL